MSFLKGFRLFSPVCRVLSPVCCVFSPDYCSHPKENMSWVFAWKRKTARRLKLRPIRRCIYKDSPACSLSCLFQKGWNFRFSLHSPSHSKNLSILSHPSLRQASAEACRENFSWETRCKLWRFFFPFVRMISTTYQYTIDASLYRGIFWALDFFQPITMSVTIHFALKLWPSRRRAGASWAPNRRQLLTP